jgi:peptidoglycan hydrolase FlgJ
MPIRFITETLSPLSAKAEDQQNVDEAKLKKVCMDFESIFIQQLLKSMREAIPQSGLFGSSSGKDIFQSLFDQEMSSSLAHQRGVGFGKMVYTQMMARLKTQE